MQACKQAVLSADDHTRTMLPRAVTWSLISFRRSVEVCEPPQCRPRQCWPNWRTSSTFQDGLSSALHRVAVLVGFRSCPCILRVYVLHSQYRLQMSFIPGLSTFRSPWLLSYMRFIVYPYCRNRHSPKLRARHCILIAAHLIHITSPCKSIGSSKCFFQILLEFYFGLTPLLLSSHPFCPVTTDCLVPCYIRCLHPLLCSRHPHRIVRPHVRRADGSRAEGLDTILCPSNNYERASAGHCLYFPVKSLPVIAFVRYSDQQEKGDTIPQYTSPEM